MPKSVNQKQKLLFLLDYLRQNTDETHTVTTPQRSSTISRQTASGRSVKASITISRRFVIMVMTSSGPKARMPVTA